jgi:xanthine/uracil/vitamin C permease (AzgA family)
MPKTWLTRFRMEERGTNVRTETIAGLTTFLTMAYIIVVNPMILSKGGMDFAGVLAATVIVSAISSVLMGLVANLPYALAPGMGIKVPWATCPSIFISRAEWVGTHSLALRGRTATQTPLRT